MQNGSGAHRGSASGKIGRQIVLPTSKAFEIAWKGIRIRLWRSLITMGGIILGIAFLTSVWTSSVFHRALHAVPPGHELYVLVQGALEAEAIAGGGARVFCAVVEPAGAGAVAGNVSPGAATALCLAEQRAFRAELVPAAPDLVGRLLTAAEGARPDVLVLLGAPEALTQGQTAAQIDAFVREGGGLLLVGEGKWGALEELMPAFAVGGTFLVHGPEITYADHVAASGVSWRSHPRAQFVETQGKPGALALARWQGNAIVWLWTVGQGTVAWYPVASASATSPDVVTWFLRGQTLGGESGGDLRAGLLTKLVAEAARQKLTGAQADTRGAWLVTLSLMVSVVGITNAMLMSVTERFREIGTMKCLGALDRFVVKLFLIESSLQGVAGSILGAAIGFLLAFLRMLLTFRVRHPETGQVYWLAIRFFPAADLLVWLSAALGLGIVLSVVAAIYPAIRAARMEPVQAMRMEA